MADLLASLRAVVGADHVITGPASEGFLVDQHRRLTGRALAVVRPADTAQVAAVVRLCVAHRTPIVPQGGNTGLVGAATPDADGRAVLLSLTRLDRIRELDTDNDTLTAEAGCVLARVQEAALAAGRLFPLSLGAQGSCTIGGNLATNAGGTQVLRYGNARELTLGLEVVTAEGDVWNGLRGLRKDNTGYDLRDVYIGSEGTLGIITAATLKLYPLPAAQLTSFLAFDSIENVVAFLSRARSGFGAALTAFEIFAGDLIQLIVRNVPSQPIPLAPHASPWYALLELSDSEGEVHARERFEAIVAASLEGGLVQDAAIAESGQQSRTLWKMREDALQKAQRIEGQNVRHDVSLPISRVPEFLHATDAVFRARLPHLRRFPYGHLGDGNLHYSVAHAPGDTPADVLALEEQIHGIVHDQAVALGGSISAEHGIGQTKRDVLPRYKSPVELALMQRIKRALDPLGLLNPGKILRREAAPDLEAPGAPGA